MWQWVKIKMIIYSCHYLTPPHTLWSSIHTAWEWDRDWYRDQMESLVPCRNVPTGLRQGQGPDPIVSYCASPVLCTGPIPVQCEKSLYPLSILEPICKFIKLKIQNRTSVSIWTTTEQCTYTQAFCVFINSRFFPFSLPPKRRQIHNFSVLFELLANILSNDVSNEFSKSVFSLLFWGLLCRVCSQHLVVECFKFCRGAVGALQHHWRHLWVNGTQQLIGVRC